MAATATKSKGRSRTVKATEEGKATARDATKMSLSALQKHVPSDGRLSYPDSITEAAKRTKELSGSNQAPGAKQVLMVLKALDGMDPVEASGMTLAQLKKYVAGEMARADSRGLRKKGMADLEKKVADPFTKSRHMGGVLLAFHEQETASKRGRSKPAAEPQEDKADKAADAAAA